MTLSAWTRPLRVSGDVVLAAVCAIAARHPFQNPKPPPGPRRARIAGDVTGLIYELLDAHYDTTQLASKLSADARWASHLEYLRDLQRVAREKLATIAQEPVA